jgi:hypothetical protein
VTPVCGLRLREVPPLARPLSCVVAPAAAGLVAAGLVPAGLVGGVGEVHARAANPGRYSVRIARNGAWAPSWLRTPTAPSQVRWMSR